MTKSTNKKGGTNKKSTAKATAKPVSKSISKAEPKKAAAKTSAKATAAKKPVQSKAQQSRLKRLLKRVQKDQSLVGHIFLGIAIVLALTYVLGVYAAFTTSLIPGKFLGVGFLLSFAITLGLVYALTKRGPGAKYSRLVVVLALVGIVVNVAVFSIGTTTKNFINSLQQTDTQTYTDYAVVALKKDGIKLSTPNQTVGVLEADNTDDLRKELAKHTPASVNPFATPTESILAMREGRAQMAVLTVAYLDELREGANNALYLELEVLATFRVKSNQAAAAKTNLNEPFVIYISGIDTYGSISTTSRSDVNILAVVNPKTRTILFVNTPRDYYVQLNGTTGTKDKLTHAGLYGIDRSEKTLEDLYGIDINYNVKINFTSLEKIVNTVGGIEVDSEYNFSSGGYSFAAGKNQLDGKQALAFSRERYSFEGGDRTRGQNQMRVLTALIGKISQPSVIVNYQSILNSLGGIMQTNMTSDDMTTLIRNQLDSMAKWNISSISVDGNGASQPTYSMGAQNLYVMIPDEASLTSAKNKINSVLR